MKSNEALYPMNVRSSGRSAEGEVPPAEQARAEAGGPKAADTPAVQFKVGVVTQFRTMTC
jgi:hypothetical protein